MQLRPECLEVIDDATENQARHRACFVTDIDVTGGDVVDMSVQGQLLIAVLHGVSERGKTSAHHQSAKARHPAPTAIVVQADIRGMDDFLHRRIPAQPKVANTSLPDLETARGNDGECHRPVLNINDLHAFLATAMKGTQLHAPAMTTPVRSANLPAGSGQVAWCVNQRPGMIAGGPCRARKHAGDDGDGGHISRNGIHGFPPYG